MQRRKPVICKPMNRSGEFGSVSQLTRDLTVSSSRNMSEGAPQLVPQLPSKVLGPDYTCHSGDAGCDISLYHSLRGGSKRTAGKGVFKLPSSSDEGQEDPMIPKKRRRLTAVERETQDRNSLSPCEDFIPCLFDHQRDDQSSEALSVAVDDLPNTDIVPMPNSSKGRSIPRRRYLFRGVKHSNDHTSSPTILLRNDSCLQSGPATPKKSKTRSEKGTTKSICSESIRRNAAPKINSTIYHNGELNGTFEGKDSHGRCEQYNPQRLSSKLLDEEPVDQTYEFTQLSTTNISPRPRTFGASKAAAARKRLVDSLRLKGRLELNSSVTSDPNGPSVAPSCGRASADFVNASSMYKTPESLDSDATGKSQSQTSSSSFSAQSGGLKVTYARQRSFLSNDDTGSNPMEKSLTSHSFELRQLRESTPPFPLLVDDDENDGTGCVRSIHELRHAGENARFQGIVDSIFEDIENTAVPLSGRRGGFIQLCENLMDHQFTRRFVETRLDRRLGAWITTRPDAILAYLALCAYGFILSIGPLHSSTLMSIWPQVLALTPSMLEIDEDISSVVRQRRLGLSRSTQAAILNIASCVRASRGLIELFPSWLSPERMALRCLELTIRKIHERGEAVDRIPDGLLTQLIGLLLKHSSNIRDFGRISIDFLMLESTFSILEAYSSLPGSLGNSHGNIIKPLAELSHLLSTLGRASECRCKELRLLYIKLLLNITNNNSSLCEEFASPGLIQSIVEIVLSDFQMATEDIACDKKNTLDTVILSLGVLINLTEESKISRKVFSTLTLESRSLFGHLLRLFSVGFEMTSEADSVVQTHFNVAFGYLSILLSTLSLDSDIRLRLKNSLGGSGLIRVLATVEEFVQYHRKVDEEMNGFECKFDSVVELTSRLQGIIDVIRRTEAESINE
ncbi:hypothetical protein Egran_04195 [Elaphomyces granulatus]|uniref:Wings apart-like protein C-terminal domain-containing protein n=1 Tax=Elaphomyces granulatus TaxID=519963 RepID=A0A232LV91_9EURO|nr:hypothetical protein Egran_04195 [Elaphomyces granulatus]